MKTTEHQALKKALEEHCLDVHGNLYTVTVKDILHYIENELPLEDKELAGKIDSLDQHSLAVEIGDMIGSVGIIELVELGVRQAIKKCAEVDI